MAMQVLTISTMLKINDKPITTDPIDQTVDVECVSSPAIIDVPADARGNMKSICPHLSKDLLRLIALRPVVLDDEGKEMNAAASKTILKDGEFEFYTSQKKDDKEYKSDRIKIAQAKWWVEEQIHLLFDEEQDLLEQLTFYNPTGHPVRVYFIEGHDLSCDEYCDAPVKK
jgi:hypothetical protein